MAATAGPRWVRARVARASAQASSRRPASASNSSRVLAKGSRVVVVGRLQQQAWTAEDGSARSTVEVVAGELGPSLRWATTTATKATRSCER